MKKQKIYLETTLFNYYFDTERDAYKPTVKLFDEIKSGKFEAYTSSYVVDEIEKAFEPKRTSMLNLIKECKIILLPIEKEAERLAGLYIKEKIIPAKYEYDAIHIAIAVINELDFILSLNFKHINKFEVKTLTAYINKRERYYKEIVICSPMEVIDNE